MKVTIKKHWANHEPILVVDTKKEALKRIKYAFYTTSTNQTFSEFLEEANICKLNK